MACTELDQREKVRVATAKRQQEYDSDPPRCLTCVYHRHEPRARFVEREVKTRRGKVVTRRFRVKANPVKNPMVHRCTFGNFYVSSVGVCDEWRDRQGQQVVNPADAENQEAA